MGQLKTIIADLEAKVVALEAALKSAEKAMRVTLPEEAPAPKPRARRAATTSRRRKAS